MLRLMTCSLVSVLLASTALGADCKKQNSIAISGTVGSAAGKNAVFLQNKQGEYVVDVKRSKPCDIGAVATKAQPPKTCVAGASFTATGRVEQTEIDPMLIADKINCN